MNYIKIFHQDGLIYFDNFRVADLVLFPTDKPYLDELLIDIQTYHSIPTPTEVKSLEAKHQTNIKLNYAHYEYAEARIVRLVDLFSDEDYENDIVENYYHTPKTINFNLLRLGEYGEMNESKGHLFVGTSITTKSHVIHFRQENGQIWLDWKARHSDRYDVEIQAEMQLRIFALWEEYYHYEQLKQRQDRLYQEVLQVFRGLSFSQNFDFEIPNVLGMSLLEKSKIAWKLAIEYTK